MSLFMHALCESVLDKKNSYYIQITNRKMFPHPFFYSPPQNEQNNKVYQPWVSNKVYIINFYSTLDAHSTSAICHTSRPPGPIIICINSDKM